MNSQRRLGLVAAAATLLAAAPLSGIFDEWTWLVQCIITVALVAGAAALARSMRAPVWGQVLAMTAALLLVLTWMFPSGKEFLAILPGPNTFAWFGQLTTEAVSDMRSYGVPVPDRDGLLFITVLGVGGVAVLVDLLAVGLRRPALAGLPMLAIYSVPVAVYFDSVPATPFVIGATGFLWLLVADNVDRVRRFGRRFTADGRDVDVWESSSLAAAGRRLTVVGVILAVLVPLAVPGLTTGLLTEITSTGGGSGPGGSGKGNGGPGRVDLFAALSGQLNQSQTSEYVKVTTTEREPFYLRFGVADVVSDEGFGNRSPAGRSVARGLDDPRETPRAGVTYQQYRATVEVTNNFDMPMLPVYASTTATEDLDSSWFYDRNMQVVYSNRSRSKGKKYKFDYVRASYSVDALRAAKPLPPANTLRTQFTAVPEVREVSELVQRLTARQRTDYDKVRAIYDSFSPKNGFTYSLQTTPGSTGPEIVAFLSSKVGFCQQYAAGMAWLVRAAGIPARVAFGFTQGESRGTGTWVMTNRNLHAWTEVYFDGIGWVPFDATPASGVVGAVRPDWAPDTSRVEPTSPSANPSASNGDDPLTNRNADDRENRDVGAGLPGTTGPAGPGASTWPWVVVGAVALVLALLAVPALRRQVLRRRRHVVAAQATAGPAVDAERAAPGVAHVVVTGAGAERAREDAHAAWDELIDTMIDFRVPVDPAETPRLTAERLTRTSAFTGAAAQGVVLLGRAEERARYARDPLQTGQFGAALDDVRRALAAQADRRTRIVASLLPPSVLLRWRAAIAERAVRAVGSAARWRASLGRVSPRRLLPGRAMR